MSANVNQSAYNLRALIARLLSIKPAPVYEDFHFDGDGSETTFELKAGWKPKWVFDGGAKMVDGAADDYTVGFDGFKYSVAFSTAPASGTNQVCVTAVRQS